MNQYEQDALVDRYLSGSMNGAEESDFFLKVAVDPELQRTLKSFRVIDRVLDQDRDVVPPQGRYRAHVMALLASTHAVAGGGAAASALLQSQGGAAAASALGGLSTGGVLSTIVGVKAIVAAVVGLGVLGGTLLVVLPKSEGVTPVTPAPSVSEQRIEKGPSGFVTPAPTVAPEPSNVRATSEKPQPVVEPTASTAERKGMSTRRESVTRHTQPSRPATIESSTSFQANKPVRLPDKSQEGQSGTVTIAPSQSSGDR